jgi:hypothetical protein
MGLVRHHGSHLAELRVADLTLTPVRYAAGTRHSEHARERACFCQFFSCQVFDGTAGNGEKLHPRSVCVLGLMFVMRPWKENR